jgi:hypothetical protein
MPVKTSFSSNIPFLNSYDPFNTQGLILLEKIEDMISYDLVPNPIRIEYSIGPENPKDLFSISMRNLTENAVLEISISEEKNILTLFSEENEEIKMSTKISLQPNETKTVSVFMTDSKLSSTLETKIFNKLTFSVENVPNGGIVTKNKQITPLESKNIVDLIKIA